eukprot:166891_1
MDDIDDLTEKTIKRLCVLHKIKTFKIKTKSESDDDGDSKKGRKPKIERTHFSKKNLIKKLKKEKKDLDQESGIKTLSDVDDGEDIKDYRRKTLLRLAKEHRVPQNQSSKNLVTVLQERYDNRSDKELEPGIQTLDDVEIDKIKGLKRETLEKLCSYYNMEIFTKKKKKKKKNDDSDDDDEEYEDEEDKEEEFEYKSIDKKILIENLTKKKQQIITRHKRN